MAFVTRAATRCKRTALPSLFRHAGSTPPKLPITVTAAYGLARPSHSVSCIPSTSQEYVVSTSEKGMLGQTGQDSFCISNDLLFFAVADGVGGWNNVEGADSAQYSRSLLMNGLRAHSHSLQKESLKPVALMEQAYQANMNNKQLPLGSSTACFVLYSPQSSILEFANLGDSGLIVVRNQSALHEESFICAPILRDGDVPYQLDPYKSFKTSQAVQRKIYISDHDVLCMATDGLFDEMEYDVVAESISKELQKQPNNAFNSKSLGKFAKELALKAYKTSFSRSVCPDDITIVLVQFNSLAHSYTNERNDTSKKMDRYY